MTKKVAFITGVTGQDGSYLAELLLSKGYEVHGIIRRSSTFNTDRIEHLYKDPHINGVKLFLHYGDLSDSSNISRLIEKIKPDEIYNLGAQSHVKVSFEIPMYTADLDALGFKGVMRPVATSCSDHMGSAWARVHTWDGAKFVWASDWLQADKGLIDPMVKASAEKYAAEKKMTRRSKEDCQQ